MNSFGIITYNECVKTLHDNKKLTGGEKNEHNRLKLGSWKCCFLVDLLPVASTREWNSRLLIELLNCTYNIYLSKNIDQYLIIIIIIIYSRTTKNNSTGISCPNCNCYTNFDEDWNGVMNQDEYEWLRPKLFGSLYISSSFQTSNHLNLS